MRERLYISQDEGISEIARKLSAFQADEFILVVPPGAEIFESMENLAFIRDTAQRLGARLYVETEDPRGERLARSLGLTRGPAVSPTSPKLYDIAPPNEELPRPTIRAALAEEVAAEQAPQPPARMKPPELQPRPASVGEPGGLRRRFPSLRRLARGALIWLLPVALASVFVAAHILLSRAELTVKARRVSRPFSERIVVRADAARLNPDERIIPGERIQLRQALNQAFKAKEQSAVRERARGVLRVINAFSSSPQFLVAGTRFTSPEGKIFRIERAVRIPGAKVTGGQVEPSSVETAAVADEAGEDGNIRAGTRFAIPGFSGTPKFEKFWAEVVKDFSGGFVGEVWVVRSQDIEAAELELRSSLLQKLEAELAAQTVSELTVLGIAKHVDLPRATSSVESGGWAQEFTLSAEGVLSTLAFRERDLKALLTLLLADDASSAPAEIRFPEAQFEFASTTGRWDRVNNVLEIDVRGVALIPEHFDVPLFRERVLGKREREIREVMFSTAAIESVALKLTPFWRRSVPGEPSRVTIRLE